MATLAARYCWKFNQLLFMQGFGMQKIHRNISQRNRKNGKWPGVAKKLISCNLCRGLECKNTRERDLIPKKHKKVLPWQHLLSGVAEKLISSNLCMGMENKELIKILVSQKKRKKVLPWHLLPWQHFCMDLQLFLCAGVWKAKNP